MATNDHPNPVIARFQRIARTENRDVLCYPYQTSPRRRGASVLVTRDGAIYGIGDRVEIPGDDGAPIEVEIASFGMRSPAPYGVHCALRLPDGTLARRIPPCRFMHTTIRH